MRPLDHTRTLGASSEAPPFDQKSNYTQITTRVSSSPFSTLGPDQDVDRVAGLAGLTFHREGAPARAESDPAKAPRPATLPFELAAVLCGHDPTTPFGAAAARHDFRVWDLVQDPTNEGAHS